MYRNLDSEKTVATIETLGRRICERFPSSGLARVCGELQDIARESHERSAWIARPNLWLRLFVALLIGASLFALGYSVSLLELHLGDIGLGESIQVVEAGLNDLVLIGAAMFFLVTMETRLKRSRALQALHELRSVAHVIDMHQLTKDPSQLKGKVMATPSSPVRDMSAYELTRYLDYCTEMLALTGKVAALYAQNFRDPVVVSAVTDLEILTSGLSRKIWQKIMILNRLEGRSVATDAARSA